MYATLEQFAEFLRSQELVMQTNWEPDQYVNVEFAEQHLTLASAKIDGTIGLRYRVPIVPSPPQLQYICMRIAHWSQEALGEIRQPVQAHYEDALSDLKDIACGKSALIGDDGVVIPTVGTDSGEDVAGRINMPMATGSRMKGLKVPKQWR